MKERGIIFSAPMVRALLDGTKTQTRRVMKSQPFSNGMVYDREFGDIVCHDDYLAPGEMLVRAGTKKHPYNSTRDEWPSLCPYGAPGDRLWVRETFCHGLGGVYYRASESPFTRESPKWKPSIHMPRWASRITLEITDVRVERVQDISEEDARAEGAPMQGQATINGKPGQAYFFDYRKGFAVLWDSIHGDGAWKRNDWVWVISFKRVDDASARGAA